MAGVLESIQKVCSCTSFRSVETYLQFNDKISTLPEHGSATACSCLMHTCCQCAHQHMGATLKQCKQQIAPVAPYLTSTVVKYSLSIPWCCSRGSLSPPCCCAATSQAFKKPDPKELVRKWQAELRAEQRNIDRQIRGESYRHASCFQFAAYRVINSSASPDLCATGGL